MGKGVPRLTALNMGGKIISERFGALNRNDFLNFLNEVKNYAEYDKNR